ncbi:MAG TPA: DUF6622 family protein [Hyphomicrobiaceae bacterium]|nr:DUF6622 family protein [Hyphomicrobiaceae bacterium]
MLQILVNTPVWVWVLLAFLLFLGVRALRPTIAPLWRTALLPSAFFLWGLSSLYELHGLRYERVLPWLAAVAGGTIVGLLIARTQTIQADKTRHLVRTAGGPMTLILILLIFATKYEFGYLHATRPDLFAEPRFWLAEIAVSGVISGMFIGRFAGLLRQYRQAPHQDLAV